MTSEWTIGTLKELDEALREADHRHFEALRAADREAVAVALQAQKEQFQEYKRTTDNRFENANEFRGQLKDQASGFITRVEFEQSQRNTSGDRLSGRTDLRGTVTLILGIAALAISVFLNFIAP